MTQFKLLDQRKSRALAAMYEARKSKDGQNRRVFTSTDLSVVALPFRCFISPPTKRRRRGQQAKKNHRGVLFDFTVAILVFAESVVYARCSFTTSFLPSHYLSLAIALHAEELPRCTPIASFIFRQLIVRDRCVSCENEL